MIITERLFTEASNLDDARLVVQAAAHVVHPDTIDFERLATMRVPTQPLDYLGVTEMSVHVRGIRGVVPHVGRVQ